MITLFFEDDGGEAGLELELKLEVEAPVVAMICSRQTG